MSKYNPAIWLKEKWDYYCDWYYLDEWIICSVIGFGLALLYFFTMFY